LFFSHISCVSAEVFLNLRPSYWLTVLIA
jgi:hypothetical protein